MFKNLVIVFALLMLPVAAYHLQGQTPSNTPPAQSEIPPEAANQSNPVKPSPESLARGKKIYSYDCAVCHGKDGDGKGDMTDMKGIPDFTDPAVQKGHTDGEWFYIIQKGKGEMPPEGDRAKSEDLWNLVNYVRAFAKSK
ncbi:MAG: c-type cytochrome [Terriglobales bacterium]